MEDNIRDKLTRELRKIQEEDLEAVPLPVIKEMLSVFTQIDSDMTPIHELIGYCLENIDNESVQTVILYRYLKFYGLIGEPDILSTRQKYTIIKGTRQLQKTPFLKEKDKEYINILLKDLNII